MTLGQLCREGAVIEDGLDGGLAVVEVAAEAEYGEVLPRLRDHLQLLQGRDAGVRVVHADAGVGAVGETVERRLARVAAGRHQDEEVQVGGAPGVRLLQRLGEEQRHALERHVLERERRAVPELEHVTAGATSRTGATCASSKLGPYASAAISRVRAAETSRPKASYTAAARAWYGIAASASTSSTENDGSRSGTNKPPPGAMPSRIASVKVRGWSMAPRVSRYRIMTRGFYRNAPAGRSPDALCVLRAPGGRRRGRETA